MSTLSVTWMAVNTSDVIDVHCLGSGPTVKRNETRTEPNVGEDRRMGLSVPNIWPVLKTSMLLGRLKIFCFFFFFLV